MTAANALLLAGVLVALLALARPTRQAVVGLLSKDRRGRTTLVVWPARKPKKRRRKGRR